MEGASTTFVKIQFHIRYEGELPLMHPGWTLVLHDANHKAPHINRRPKQWLSTKFEPGSSNGPCNAGQRQTLMHTNAQNNAGKQHGGCQSHRQSPQCLELLATLVKSHATQACNQQLITSIMSSKMQHINAPAGTACGHISQVSASLATCSWTQLNCQ